MMQVMDEDGTWRDSNISAWSVLGRCFAACLALIGCGMAYYAYRRGTMGSFSADDLLLLVLAGLAATGFFCLICFALGICRFSMGDPLKSPVAKLLNQMPSAIVITDNSGTIRYMNASYRRLNVGGKQTPQALLLRDEKAAGAVHRLSLAAKEGRQIYEELHLATPLLSPDDSKSKQAGGAHDFYVYAVHVSPMEVDGETLSIWSIADFTHLRNRQETLFEDLQEAVYHLDHAPAGFLSWNERGRLVYLNATLAGWLGLDLAGGTPDNLELEQLFGSQNAAELCNAIPPTTQENQKPLLLDMQMAHGRASLHCYLSAQDKMQNGVQRALLIPPPEEEIKQEATPALITQAAITPAPTENIQNEEQDNALFLHLLDASPIAMAVMDEEGIIHQANARFATLLHKTGDDKQEQPPLTLENLVDPRDRQRIMQACARVLDDHDVAPIDTISAADLQKTDEIDETQHRAANEEQTRHIRLFFSADARIARHFAHPVVLIGAVEITDQRILEQQLEQGQKMQAVGQLAGGIAHDFNNVLTAIIMSCDLLLSSHRSSDPSHPDIMNIKNNAGRAAALVRQLLAFSRRQTLRPEILDLTDMLADSRLLLARLVGMSIGLKIEHGRDLWPVMADQAELERVIINLATNAHDGLLTIRTANIARDEVASLNHPELAEKDYVLIEVKDSGSGIAPEIKEKIFEPFFTTKEVGKGTGLGLSMVYGIVAQTGGAIYCHSEPGEGACFSIYLPRHIADEVAAEQDATTEDEAAPNTLISPPPPSLLVDLSGTATILVVEDEDAVRLGSVKALQSRGYHVLEAATGAQALKIVAEQNGQIDLIVSDVVMPEMDGPTLLKELRLTHPHIKFIFVSGYAEDAFAKNLPDDAQFAFLPKPFSLKQLATTVKESLTSGLNG